jgi:hypothetical protein
MHFDLFRISLTPRAQIDFEVYRNPDGSQPTREQWLRIVFGRPIEFNVKQVMYVYTPIDAVAFATTIDGRIGRKTIKTENLPPSEGFAEIERDAWQAADVIIDPVAHGDGQKLAMEWKDSVGRPSSILEALAAYLNQSDYQSPYGIEIGAISEPQTFWAFVEENYGQITSLTLEVPVPNMFGHQTDFDEEMRAYRDKEKAQTVTLTLKNPAGLQVDTENIKNGVEYAAKTGGTIKARARRGKTYNSKKKGKRVIPPFEFSSSRTSMLEWIKSKLLQGLSL